MDPRNGQRGFRYLSGTKLVMGVLGREFTSALTRGQGGRRTRRRNSATNWSARKACRLALPTNLIGRQTELISPKSRSECRSNRDSAETNGFTIYDAGLRTDL